MNARVGGLRVKVAVKIIKSQKSLLSSTEEKINHVDIDRSKNSAKTEIYALSKLSSTCVVIQSDPFSESQPLCDKQIEVEPVGCETFMNTPSVVCLLDYFHEDRVRW